MLHSKLFDDNSRVIPFTAYYSRDLIIPEIDI